MSSRYWANLGAISARTSRASTTKSRVGKLAGICDEAGVTVRDIDLLVTNQPNPIFVRNWREALELAPEVNHDTFDTYGNLFGAALPINIEDALARGKLASGNLLALGGFSHAGDYAAAAVVRWRAHG